MTPQREADEAVAKGRMRKAEQFAQAASLFLNASGEADDLADAFVTLAVHSGIASADVICIRRLGVYAPTGDHAEAIKLLGQAHSAAAKHLVRLLSMKTKAGYTHRPASAADVQTADRAHRTLLELAGSSRW